MKSAVLAVTPTLSEKPVELKRLCRQIRELQNRGLLGSVSIASVMHPDLYPYPASYYQLMKFGLTHQNRERLESYMRKWFKFGKVHMLSTPSSENATLAERLSDFARKRQAEVLVVNQSGARGWIGKLFSRVAEATAFSAALPVLVLNSDHEEELASSEARILFAIDPQSTPSDAELGYVVNAAKLMAAEVHLLYVRPANRSFAKKLRERLPASTAMRELRRLETYFRERGVRGRSVMVEEDESVASAIEQYAEDNLVCLSVVTSPVRPFFRKFLLGSTVKRLLRVSKRPVFVLRVTAAAKAAAKAAALLGLSAGQQIDWIMPNGKVQSLELGSVENQKKYSEHRLAA